MNDECQRIASYLCWQDKKCPAHQQSANTEKQLTDKHHSSMVWHHPHCPTTSAVNPKSFFGIGKGKRMMSVKGSLRICVDKTQCTFTSKQLIKYQLSLLGHRNSVQNSWYCRKFFFGISGKAKEWWVSKNRFVSVWTRPNAPGSDSSDSLQHKTAYQTWTILLWASSTQCPTMPLPYRILLSYL